MLLLCWGALELVYPISRDFRLWCNPSRLWSGKIVFPVSRPFKEEQNTLVYFRTVLSFFWYLLWRPGRAPGDKTQKILGLPYDRVLMEFFSLRLVRTESSAIFQLFLRLFLLWYWFPWRFLLEVYCDFCIHVLVSLIFGAVVCHVISQLQWIYEELLIFEFSPLLVRMEWWLLRSLPVRPKTPILHFLK